MEFPYRVGGRSSLFVQASEGFADVFLTGPAQGVAVDFGHLIYQAEGPPLLK